MLTLVESRNEKIEAQRKLAATLEKLWPARETRVVVWRPDSREIRVAHNGRYWFASLNPDNSEGIPKYWNPFGRYQENGNLQIAVEINIPTRSNSKRVAGFFARDGGTGMVYLVHDGGVGGGRKGVGRDPFLAWSDAKLTPVANAQGEIRPGIIVAAVESRTTGSDVARFVQKALDFKQAVQAGETITARAQAAQRTFKDYYDEFSGKKRRRRVREVEYISRHGDIVRALRVWRKADSKSDERIVKNAYIDLGIQVGGNLTELYEVKTNCDRQTLYSAIGQVVVHDEAQAGTCKRFLTLPNDEIIPTDVDGALKRASIAVLRFELVNDKIRILGRPDGAREH